MVHKLREVLASEGGGSSQGATADEPTDAEERISVEKAARKRLWSEPWGQAKIVSGPAIRTALDEDTPLVVLAQNDEEFEQVEKMRKAMGRTDVTFVVLSKAGKETVLFEGPKGVPTATNAKILRTGDKAPEKVNLSSEMKDDAPMVSGKVKPCAFRITVVREFASEALFNQCAAEPQTTPAAIVGAQLAAKVFRTKGATAYDDEVTCVISIPEQSKAEFNAIKPPRGAFVMQQEASEPPRWFARKDEEEGDDGAEKYLDRVLKIAQEKQGVLLYRPSSKFEAALGASGIDGCAETEAVRWYINKAPAHWVTVEEVEAWTLARGFINVKETKRVGSRAWTFQGDTPAGVKNTVFQFDSGTVVTRSAGKSSPDKKPEKAEQKPSRSRWGAPPVASQASPQDFPALPGTSAKNEVNAPSPQRVERKARAKESEDEPPAVRQKGAAGEAVNKMHDPPFKRFFNADPNKGNGRLFLLERSQRTEQAVTVGKNTD